MPSALEETWFVLDVEPDMDDMMEQAGDSLDDMVERFEVNPFQSWDNQDRVFLAQFEFPKSPEDDATEKINFMTGFPMDAIEMLVTIGEYSTKEDKVDVLPGDNRASAPVPDDFFAWPEEDKILLNYTAIPSPNMDWMASSLEGGKEPRYHWWFRVDGVPDDAKWPVPGEFLALGVRMMPDVPWGAQKSSPFMYSGNWMDTFYYTGAVILEIIEPDTEFPFPRYVVQWRGQEIVATPSDFAEYQVGDRVTILKDFEAEKEKQTWKDEDMQTWDEKWVIVPITFYGLDQEE
jgi:hypothetical protein